MYHLFGRINLLLNNGVVSSGQLRTFYTDCGYNGSLFLYDDDGVDMLHSPFMHTRGHGHKICFIEASCHSTLSDATLPLSVIIKLTS